MGIEIHSIEYHLPSKIRTNDEIAPLILNESNLSISDLDYFIFHQANKFILEHLKKKLGIPSEKFLIDIEDSGNTVSSTIPILIANKRNQDINFFKNKTVMLVGFGVGYSWGAVILKM